MSSQQKKTETPSEAQAAPAGEIKPVTPTQVEVAEEKQNSIAKRLAVMLSPIIAKELADKRVAFVGLSIVVDNQFSITFPFHPVETEDMNEETRNKTAEAKAKAVMLASFEYARTAGSLKRIAIQSLDECLDKRG